MKPFIRLGFVGTYKVDLLHYFSRILIALNKEVVIVDATKEQYLQATIPEPINNVTTYQGVDYVVNHYKMNQLSTLDYSQYDIALIDYGLNEEIHQDYINCTIIFVVTDFERHNVLKLKNILNEFNQSIKVVKIYRDVILSKISCQYINHLLDIEVKAKVLAEYLFEFKEADYRCKLLCQYNNNFTFKKLTKEYKRMFADIVEELYDVRSRETIKAIKVAEEGKICR